jgi:hypothetical protein
VTSRRENITDWLEQFRFRYGDRSITKWNIFHYIYAVLHHPEYRERYAANLRRELPRIPFADDTLSSRAQQDGSLASNPAESRDLVHADAEQRHREVFSARASSIRVRVKNASEGHAELQADTGSFDSENGLASEPTLSAQDDRAVLTQDDRVDVKAQDDRAGVMGDLELFGAFRQSRKAPG